MISSEMILLFAVDAQIYIIFHVKCPQMTESGFHCAEVDLVWLGTGEGLTH